MQFEVGKSYYPSDRSYDPITVIRRTPKCIVVRNWSGTTWRMVVRHGKSGEYVVDSCVPAKWRNEFTYFADNVVDSEE